MIAFGYCICKCSLLRRKAYNNMNSEGTAYKYYLIAAASASAFYFLLNNVSKYFMMQAKAHISTYYIVKLFSTRFVLKSPPAGMLQVFCIDRPVHHKVQARSKDSHHYPFRASV